VSHLEWIILAVGVGLGTVIIVAASEVEKRLNRIIELLIVANRQREGD
jgi:hypothetical protein